MNARARPAARARPRPLRALRNHALSTPLIAALIALFFWVQQGRGWRGFVQIFTIAFVFSAVISLCLWLADAFVRPRLAFLLSDGGPAGAIRNVAFSSAMAVIGTFAGVLVVRATLLPGLLGSPRTVLLFVLYFILFLALALGLTLAGAFFQHLEAQVRSDHELRLARRIQSSFLPTEFPALPVYDVHAVNVASREVSGDFYDVVTAHDGAVLLAIADVSGKGVPAALLSSMLQASLRTQAAGPSSVAGILDTINRLLLQQHSVGRFATIFLARLDASRGRLTYSNAGHNPPLLQRAAGRMEALEIGGTIVGILEGVTWAEGTVDLGTGDRLVLYTDGITEAAGPSGELFGDERLRDALRRLPPGLPSREVAVRLLDEVDRFTGGSEPDDDRTLLVLRVRTECAA